MLNLPITEILVLFIWLGGSPFSTSHTYIPLSSAVTLSIVRLLLECSSQLSHTVGAEVSIVILERRIEVNRLRSLSSVPFFFSHMILGAGSPVDSQVIVTEADSLIVPPPVINGELGGTDENSCSGGGNYIGWHVH